MAPALEVNSTDEATNGAKKPTLKPTSILHRTPWQPPVAVAGEGVYIDLEDGRRLIDGVGGAAVACLGNSHPTVIKALKDQIDKVPCTFNSLFSVLFFLMDLHRCLQYAAV